MKKSFATLCAGAIASLVAMNSEAATGYICEVTQYNYSGFGSNGGLLIRFYSGPKCTGSYQYTGYVCTAGSTTPSCTTSSYYTFSEAQLLRIYQVAADSGRNGNQVLYWTSGNCRNGGTSCLDSFYFQSN